MRLAYAAWFPVLMLIQCSEGSTSDVAIDKGHSCTSGPDFGCADFCGSDVVEQAICIDGDWKCPRNMLKSSDCPPGTCFGFSQCCGPTGEHTSKICPTGGTPSPSSGHCPDGYYDCYGPDSGANSDASADADALPPFDAAGAVSECLGMGYDCQFCCGKFFWDEMVEYDKTVRDCACAPSGPCVAACLANGFCSEPQIVPAGECETCLLQQRDTNAPCVASAATCHTSATCEPYLACLTSCGG